MNLPKNYTISPINTPKNDVVALMLKNMSVSNDSQLDLHSGQLEEGGYGKVKAGEVYELAALLLNGHKVCGEDFVFIRRLYRKLSNGAFQVSFEKMPESNAKHAGKTIKEILK